MPPRLHLLLRRGGRVLLLPLLTSAFLQLAKAVVYPLRVTRLYGHRAAKWMLCKCALGPFLSVLVIKCLTHHVDLTYNCEYELRVKAEAN
jgi:hypothetical protein